MKKKTLRIALALIIALCAATAAMAAPSLYFGNVSRGRISSGETNVNLSIYFAGFSLEVNDTGEATTGTLTLTSTKDAVGAYYDDNNIKVGDQQFTAGTPVTLHLKRMQGATGEYYMEACNADGNRLSFSSNSDQTAFSGASFAIKAGSEPEVKGTIPTMRTTEEFTDEIGMPYLTLRYSDSRDMIEGVDWKFVKRSDPKTVLTYRRGGPIARMQRIRAVKYEGVRENKVIGKTFTDGEKMEGSIIFDKPVELVDLQSVQASFFLSDALDTSKVYAVHNFNYYMQGPLLADSGVNIRQSFVKAKGGDGTYSSIGLPKADNLWFEVTGPGANKSGTIEFTPPKDVTASYSRNGVVEATEVYKAGVKKIIDLVRVSGLFTAYMEPRDAEGRYISFKAVDDDEENIYVLSGTRYTVKVGNSTIEDIFAPCKRASVLVRDDATPNIKCTVNGEGKITKIDWWFSKGEDRSAAATYADGDEINYLDAVQIRGGKGKDRVRINAPGSGKFFSNGEKMAGTWELTQDQYISPDDIQSIRVYGAHRYQDSGSWKTIFYTTMFLPVAEDIKADDVKDDGSDGAKVESAEPNQPAPSEIVSALEDLVDAMKKVMDIIKDSPVLKAFEVINTIKLNVSHTKDDGTANIAIENFEREPKAGHEFVVLTKRKGTATDNGKWDMHRGVKYDRTAKKLSFSIPNVGMYFSASDIVLAEAQIDGGSNGGGSSGCAAGTAVMLALGCLVAIKARKR